jgi:hypothetical protein
MDCFVAVAPCNDGKQAMRFCHDHRLHPLPARSLQARAVEEYSRRWLSIIPRCGGDLQGYWMPHEGTSNIAFALISFESLAAYEAYRARLRSDREGMANFNFAEENKFILAEERTFLRKVVA